MNEWTYPSITRSKLFVFDDLTVAKKFLNKWNIHKDHALFECEIKGVPQSGAGDSGWAFGTFWSKVAKNKKNKKKWNKGLNNFNPTPSVFVDAVKLTKHIEIS